MEPIGWTTLEHAHQEKSPDWFWALGIVAVSSAIAAVIFGNVLFALVLLIGALAVALYASRPPRQIQIVLTERGVVLDRRLVPYGTIDKFHVADGSEHEPPKLLLKTSSVLTPHLSIYLSEVDPELVRAYLAPFVIEEEHHEPISVKIFERLGL